MKGSGEGNSSNVSRLTFHGFKAENTPAARREQGKAACSTEAVSLRWLHETNERGQTMIRAIIFDFNGVIAADETPHLRFFQQALAEHDADGRESFAAVERSMSDRLLTTYSPRTTDRSRSCPAEFGGRASRID